MTNKHRVKFKAIGQRKNRDIRLIKEKLESVKEKVWSFMSMISNYHAWKSKTAYHEQDGFRDVSIPSLPI